MFSWLAYNTLCALPLALVARLTRRWARSQPALEHALWLLVLLRLVWPPLSLWTLLSPAAPVAGAANAPAILSSGPPSLGDELVAGTTRLLGPNWSTWGSWILLGLYLAVLVRVTVREIARARAVERCVARARDADRFLARHVRRVATRLGVPVPRVRVSQEAAGPFLWSPLAPVIVLPAADALPAPTVLAHEFAHLARRDPWSAWLELAVQALHFWNPLFWFARRELHRAAELACDHWVVRRFPAERRAFAAALIDTAERAAHGGFVPRAAQALGTDARDFEERLVRILQEERRVRTPRGLLAGVGLCAFLLLPGWGAPSLADFRRALPELPAGTDREHWRRTLDAAELRLANDPEDGAAVAQRGLALLGLERADEASAAFQFQRSLGFESAKALYNEACARVRLAEPEAALECLQQAAALGLDVAACAAADPDLEPLRAHPALVALARP